MDDMIFDTPRLPRFFRISSSAATAALGLLVVLLVVWRIGAPSDIYDNDQPTPIAHVIDVAVNGHWQMQSNPAGKLITKPPMYPWLGALCVRATGLVREWVVKLPLLGGFVVITLVVLDLGRKTLGWPLACLAAAFWASNFHVFKLMYTARTDMLVTMWIAVALWSAERQRRDWMHHRSRSHPVHIFIFWLAVAGGLLTKGPVALLAAGWWFGILIYHRMHKRCRPVWQLAAMTVGLALVLMWLLPTQAAYPDWWRSMFSHEVTQRIMGTGSGAHRQTPMLAIPGYFFARFAPWSFLVVIGALGLRRQGRALHWALIWTVAVLLVFMIPAGKRADYILPVYIGAALIGAFAVACYQVGSLPLQALLGANELMAESVLARLDQADGGILVTSQRAWSDIADRYDDRFELYLTTPPVSSASLRLMVLRIFGP